VGHSPDPRNDLLVSSKHSEQKDSNTESLSVLGSTIDGEFMIEKKNSHTPHPFDYKKTNTQLKIIPFVFIQIVFATMASFIASSV
jgi:hypothetical protein